MILGLSLGSGDELLAGFGETSQGAQLILLFILLCIWPIAVGAWVGAFVISHATHKVHALHILGKKL